MGRLIMSIIFSWILSSSKIFTIMVESAAYKNATIASVARQYGENNLGDHQPPMFVETPLICYFCRSDKEPECINRPLKVPAKECNWNNFDRFRQGLNISKPRRPGAKPRSEETDTNWACYRVKTADESFTLRMCVPVPPNEYFLKEKCTRCKFDDVGSTCCHCSDSYCNDANSDATSYKNVAEYLLTHSIISILTLLIIY